MNTTKEERLIAAKRAREYPLGYGGSWTSAKQCQHIRDLKTEEDFKQGCPVVQIARHRGVEKNQMAVLIIFEELGEDVNQIQTWIEPGEGWENHAPFATLLDYTPEKLAWLLEESVRLEELGGMS